MTHLPLHHLRESKSSPATPTDVCRQLCRLPASFLRLTSNSNTLVLAAAVALALSCHDEFKNTRAIAHSCQSLDDITIKKTATVRSISQIQSD